MNLGPWRSTVQGDAGLFIAGTHVKSGAHALRMLAPIGGGSRGTLNQKQLDCGLIPGNRLFGRAWVYYAADADAGLPLMVHSWFFQANGPGADGGNTSINLGGGGTRLQLNYHFPASSNEQSVQGWHGRRRRVALRAVGIPRSGRR